jgi:hypothetical protein
MLVRVGQMAVAVLGMALILHYGITRDPGWGETSSLHPVIWTIHWGALGAGIVCLLLTFVLIGFLGRE